MPYTNWDKNNKFIRSNHIYTMLYVVSCYAMILQRSSIIHGKCIQRLLCLINIFTLQERSAIYLNYIRRANCDCMHSHDLCTNKAIHLRYFTMNLWNGHLTIWLILKLTVQHSISRMCPTAAKKLLMNLNIFHVVEHATCG